MTHPRVHSFTTIKGVTWARVDCAACAGSGLDDGWPNGECVACDHGVVRVCGECFDLECRCGKLEGVRA